MKERSRTALQRQRRSITTAANSRNRVSVISRRTKRREDESKVSKGNRRQAETKRDGKVVGPTDDEMRDALATELLAVCVNTLKEQGLSTRRISEFAKNAIEYQDGIPATTRLFQDVSDLGRLASEWTDNAAYVDSLGRPKVLPIAGSPPSFCSLVAKYFCGRPVAEVLQLGYRTRVFEPVGSNKVAHLGPCVLLTGEPLMLLGHAVRSIRWFLGTANYNARPRQSTLTTWPERQAFTELSARDFDGFVKFMRNPIINLTEMGNRWLMTRAANQSRTVKGRKVVMGVQAYVFRDT